MTSGEERKQLARIDEESQITSYVVRNRQYVLAEAADLTVKCDCCTEPCRYYNFRHCSISDDPNDDPPCMEDMPEYISICTRQFTEFDRLRRECDEEFTDWWFRVRFWDGAGEEGTGCYGGKTIVQIPEDPENPNGTSSPRGQVVVRNPKEYAYCNSECCWARGSWTGSGLPRLVDEKNNGCDPQNNPDCSCECGYWDIEGKKFSDLCAGCCKQECWYQDYKACTQNEEECSGYRERYSVLCKCVPETDDEDNTGSPFFCCPDGCPGGYTQQCMPDTIKRGTCCFNKLGGLYKVNPDFGSSQPHYSIMYLGDPPCDTDYQGCNDQRCKEYVEPPELECRSACRDCYCEYQEGVGWVPAQRDVGIVSFTILCVGSPYSPPGPECGQSFTVFVRRDGMGNSWTGTKGFGDNEVSVTLRRTGSCGGCGMDADPPGTTYQMAGCWDGCGSDGFYCHCQNGGPNCKGCDPNFCRTTSACEACGLGVDNPTFPCEGENDGSQYFCWPFSQGPCGSCCNDEDNHGEPWCEGNNGSDEDDVCCGWWPGDGSYAKCQQGPYGACDFEVIMRYNGVGRQCVHCPGGLSCNLQPMAENVHFPHESGCGGNCPICEEPEEGMWTPPNRPCYYENGYGKVYKCTGVQLLPPI